MKYRCVTRNGRAQLKLWVDVRLREEIQKRAEENGISANAMAVMLLNQALVGAKPRVRVKAPSVEIRVGLPHLTVQ